MDNQKEQEMWETILSNFDKYIYSLAKSHDLSLAELSELQKQQDVIAKSLEEYFKNYGMKQDKTEIIRTRFAKSQQLFENAKEQIRAKMNQNIDNFNAHEKYIQTKYNN